MKFRKLQERISQNLYYVSSCELVGGLPWVGVEGIHIATDINVCRNLAEAHGFTDPHYYEVKVKPRVLQTPLYMDYDLGVWSAQNIAEELLKKDSKERYTSGTESILFPNDPNHYGDTIPTTRIHTKKKLDDRSINYTNIIKGFKTPYKMPLNKREQLWGYVRTLLKKLGYTCISYTNHYENTGGSLCYILTSSSDIISCRPRNDSLKEDVKYLDKERDIRDYGTGVAEGTDTFTKVTGTSFYDNLITKPDYMREHENMVGEIKYMTPLEYYKECSDIFSNDKHFVSVEDLKRQRSHDSRIIDELTDIVSKYHTKLYMPYLNYAEKQQEGLHRMLAMANLFGWSNEKFPVLIINWADEDLHKKQVDYRHKVRCEMDIDNAIKEALRYTYPTDTEECIEYLKEQIEWELERHCREMTDEEVRHAIDTLKINITDETIIFTIDGEDYEYPKSYLKQEEKEPDDLDNIDDLLDQDDLGVADYFIK